MQRTVIRSHAVFTGLDDRPSAGGVVIEGDRIAYVGPAEGLEPYLPGARVIDAGNGLVCPGLIDSHLHFFTAAVNRSRFAVFCEGTCAEDCVAALAQVEDARPHDEFLLSYGWYHPLWSTPELPTKEVIDRVYPDRPVCLMGADVHTLWLNSKALEVLGITDDAVPPAGGIYQRDASGHLTGIVQEAAAFALLPRIYRVSPEEGEEAVAALIGDLHACGITGVGDMALTPQPGSDLLCDRVFEQLEQAGRLGLRVSLFPAALGDYTRVHELEQRFSQSALVRVGGLKQFFDGVTSTHTAWLSEPYSNAAFSDDAGRPTIPAQRMRELVLDAAAHGYATRIHTIGDRAVSTALDFFAEARERYGAPRVGTYGLEHLEYMRDEDIPRLAELVVCANVQPPHATLDPEGTVRDMGLARARRMWPFASYARAGACFSFGTDAPVVDIDSRAVLYDAVTRRDAVTGRPEGGWVPEECLGLADALRAYTLGSAAALGRERELGTLEAGKLADLTIFAENLFDLDVEDLRTALVRMTIVGGKVVYEA